ncbi:MAG TPA: type IV toxin-antitoxin system AbiEi family antitoxin domain-containing protein [Solirubrobacterales bacterium]|nr:type IV toxin-antitoxin system AbiEi family antitoxin domain-containing protein [Solirubrobacterales bacterium]
MTPKKHHSISKAVWALVDRQHGVVARRQLIGLGVGEEAIRHRLATGRLRRVERGIYAVGRPELSREGRWMAAVLSCGSRAALSHSSAAALLGLGRELRGCVEVSVPYVSPRRRPGIRVHRRPKMREADVVERFGVPVTAPIRTIIDQAAWTDEAGLERLVNNADKLDLVDPVTLLAALARYPGQRGVGSLRALLGDRIFLLTDSELERRFLRLVRGARLPVPETQRRVNGYLVDFFWPDLELVVETDGLRYHRTPTQQLRDHRRGQAHTAAGFAHLRFTHAQVRYEAEDVRATLVRTIRRLEAQSDRAAGSQQRSAAA